MPKFTLENKLFGVASSQIFGTKNFLFFASATIFLLSIFVRSLIDIGPDTGIYLNLGKKFAEGKRYYYDIFESNFPASFYFYAVQNELSQILDLSPILLSEIIINLLGLLSIFWSAKILKKSEIGQNPVYFNLLVISFFLGFFLRPQGLPLGEFGTKTSLILLLLYPYFAFSFRSSISFKRSELILRGALMGLMPCLKPHYLIFPLLVEIWRSFERKSFKSLFELDKLIAAMIYLGYLVWMLFAMPEFFEFMVPMWSEIYASYNNNFIFFSNSQRLLAAHIGVFIFVFLLFSRVKADRNDQVLIVFFIAAALIFILENAMTIDQSVIFYAIATSAVLKLAYDFYSSPKVSCVNNKFILASLFLIPLSDLGILPAAIFGLSGFINAWWVVLPLLIYRNISFLIVYFLALSITILTISQLGNWAFVSLNLLVIFAISFFYEKKIDAKKSANFSRLSFFLFSASVATLFHIYLADISDAITRKKSYTYPNKISDMINFYAKKNAPDREDGMIMISTGNALAFPRINYLKKDNYMKFHSASMLARSTPKRDGLMFNIADADDVFVNSYLFEDMFTAIKNPRTKVIFINNSADNLIRGGRCLVGSLEYYFQDPRFREFFLKNYRFENRVVIEREVNVVKNSILIGSEPSVFDQITKSKKQISNEFEVYLRQ